MSTNGRMLYYSRCLLVFVFAFGIGTWGVTKSCADDTEGKIDASKAPLTQDERDAFLKSITSGWLASEQKMAEGLARKYANRSLFACLRQVIEDDRQPIMARMQAMSVLGQTRDAQGIPMLRTIVDRPLKEDMSSDEYHMLHAAILTLGHLADDAVLDLLFEMAKEDYWLARNPKASEKDGKSKSFRDAMRQAALSGISYSGSERAIKAFTTKEGVPADKQRDCESLLGGAKYNQKTRAEREKH